MFAAIFLDRDGTVNEEREYIASPDELCILPGSAEAIRLANDSGYKVVIITNQSAVARGLITEEDLRTIHERLREILSASGAHIDGIYYCPHHPDFGDSPYRIECECRKPLPGMLRQAATDLDIDLSRSFMIGDRIIDLQTGNSAGSYSILVRTGYGSTDEPRLKQSGARADFVADNLAMAMQHITTAFPSPLIRN